MFNNLKGLSADNTTLDLLSSAYYNPDAPQDFDQSQIFYPGSLDHFANLPDDLNPAQLLSRLNPDLVKSMGSPKKEFQINHGNSMVQKKSLLGFRNDQEMSEEDKLKDHGDDDDDEDGSDSGSDSDPSKKRGKYRTYTDDEKAHIITFMMKHGMQKTLEIFSGGEHKITKRKLKSWLDGQHKVKGVKGRKSNDPIRDQQLYEWCMDFQNEHGRPPSRKESTKKALELSGDPNFQASKGWLDKFSRKYNIEFTPLKIIPPRTRKHIKTDNDSGSGSATTSTLESTLTGSISPFKEAKTVPELGAKKYNSAPIKETVPQQDREIGLKPNPHFSSSLKSSFQPQVQQQQPRQTSPLYQQGQNNGAEGDLGALDSNMYSGFPAQLEGGQNQGFPYNPFYPPVDYTMPYLLNYPKMAASQGVSCRKAYPMNYPMNLPLNYQMQFAENLQRLQQMMGKESESKVENQKGM